MKRPDFDYWIIQDDLGFPLVTNDRDGWRAKRTAETLNFGEEVRDAQRSPHRQEESNE